MRVVAASIFVVLLAVTAAPALAQPTTAPARKAGTPELLQALARGGYVIYFRHGHTNWQEKLLDQVYAAEARFDLNNCASQRNLDAIGRDDARRINAALRAASVPIGKVYGSRFCRPSEYARIITGIDPERVDWLTGLSTTASMMRLREVIATVPDGATNTILGGHGERPFDLTGLVISEGDALVFDPRAVDPAKPGHYPIVAWIKPQEWLDLASVLQQAKGDIPAVRSFVVRGDSPIRHERLAAALAPLIGAPATVATLNGADLLAEAALRAAGAGTTRVEAGTVREDGLTPLTLRQHSIGAVNVLHDRYFDTANVRASLPDLLEGQVPDTRALARGLQLAREHPSKNTTVQFVDSRRGGRSAVDADVSIHDTKPWYGYAGANNAGVGSTGAGSTGRARVFAGGGYTNLWNRDHTLAGSVTSRAGAWDEVWQWGATYRAPIYAWGGAFTAYAGRSTVAGGLVAEGIRFATPGRVAGFSYKQHLVPRGDYHHHLLFALEDRSFADPAFAASTRSRPFSVGYGAHWEEQWSGWKFAVRAVQNASGGSENDNDTYARVRPGATDGWRAMRAEGDHMRILTYDWRLVTRARGQLTRNRLLPGEQMALGGEQTFWGTPFGVFSRMPWIEAGGVRGLGERAVTGDAGAQASVELWSWRLLPGQDLRAGVFCDVGQVRRRSAISGERAADSASSTGVGLHYQWRGQIAATIHYAHVLHAPSDAGAGRDRVHASVAMRF